MSAGDLVTAQWGASQLTWGGESYRLTFPTFLHGTIAVELASILPPALDSVLGYPVNVAVRGAVTVPPDAAGAGFRETGAVTITGLQCASERDVEQIRRAFDAAVVDAQLRAVEIESRASTFMGVLSSMPDSRLS